MPTYQSTMHSFIHTTALARQHPPVHHPPTQHQVTHPSATYQLHCICIFYPNALSHIQASSLAAAYRNHECGKNLTYSQREENLKCLPYTFVLSSTGGMGAETTTFYKRLASLIADNTSKSYNQMMTIIRCKRSFARRQSATVCWTLLATRFALQHRVIIINSLALEKAVFLSSSLWRVP